MWMAPASEHRYRIGATYKHPNGAVLLDSQYCTGCGKCIEACPYGVRWFHPSRAGPAGQEQTGDRQV